jgi:RNA polymerase sigma-70 factor (ECF subfamily)
VTLAVKADERPDDARFPDIFHEYAPFVLRAMRHLGVGSADLNDQCQDVFVAVFQGLEGFGGRSSLRTWIYGICRHTAANYRRRAYIRRERAVADVPERATPPNQYEELERQQGSQQLQALLEVLDDDKREAFVLYELEELSMKEVAAICDCPLQTAYSRLHAARRLLLEAYRQREVAR